MALLAVFFAQFDNKTGPRLTLQVPERFLEGDAFDEISKIVIPKPFLCGSLLSIERPRYTVVGVPVLLRSAKYHRNALLFNFCFVLRTGISTSPYEPLLRKIASTLRAMEQESGFISSAQGLGPVQRLCEICFSDLNAKGECAAPLDAGNTVFLKVQNDLKALPAPKSWEVPVPTTPLCELQTHSWDLTVLRVAQCLDGVRCVRDIARSSRVDVPLACQSIRALVMYGVCKVLPCHSLFSSRYACTPRAARLLHMPSLALLCCRSLNLGPHALPRVALLYSRLHPSLSLRAVLTACRFPTGANVAPFDVARFVAFGLLNGLIRRVQPYVVAVDNAQQPEEKSLDQIIVESGLPLDEHQMQVALEKYSSNPAYIILWK